MTLPHLQGIDCEGTTLESYGGYIKRRRCVCLHSNKKQGTSWFCLVCEELMAKGLLDGHAVGRVDDEDAFEEVFAFGAEAFEGQ